MTNRPGSSAQKAFSRYNHSFLRALTSVQDLIGRPKKEKPLSLKKLATEIKRARVYPIVKKTPLTYATQLSKNLGNQVFFKREDLQQVFSFKIRGAYYKIKRLKKLKKITNGVIASSAGNHAQGVALAASICDLRAVIVMPLVTPPIKVNAVRNLGAEVILHGDRYDDAFTKAVELAKERKLDFIAPFDDEQIMIGQGTCGREIAKQCKNQRINPSFYAFIPVGGGGLISGVGAYLKYAYPQCKIIAVEPEESPTLYRSFEHKKRTVLKNTGIFADGVSVKQLGHNCFEVAKQVVDDTLLVSNDEMCSAIESIFNDTRSISEPSGALAIAGLEKYARMHQLKNQSLISIITGANINFDRLRYVAERAKFGSQKELLMAVTIPEVAGAYRDFCNVLANYAITEFNYRYCHQEKAQVFVGLELLGHANEVANIFSQLKDKGYHEAHDLSDDEVAKNHIRHMVGGKSKVDNERLINFRFPERKGALLQFLNQLQGWNISLFHYRSHGAPYGDVLVGIQVPESEQEEFHRYLDQLGYDYKFVDGNTACETFL